MNPSDERFINVSFLSLPKE